MFGRCALRVRQCIHFARKRGVLSRRSAARSGPLVARHRQVHAPCEAEAGNGHKRRSAKQAHRCGVRGYKDARRKRLVRLKSKEGTIYRAPTKSRINERRRHMREGKRWRGKLAATAEKKLSRAGRRIFEEWARGPDDPGTSLRRRSDRRRAASDNKRPSRRQRGHAGE